MTVAQPEDGAKKRFSKGSVAAARKNKKSVAGCARVLKKRMESSFLRPNFSFISIFYSKFELFGVLFGTQATDETQEEDKFEFKAKKDEGFLRWEQAEWC